MSVTSTNAYSGPYVGSGATRDFPFTFNVGSTNEVIVEVDGVAVSTSLYSVAINPDGNGGTITFGVAPIAAEIFIRSNPDFSQNVGLTNGGPFQADVIDEAFDKGTRRDIYLKDRIERIPEIVLEDETAAAQAAAANAETARAAAATSAAAAAASVTAAGTSATNASAASAQAALYASAAAALAAGYLFDTAAEGVSQGVVSLTITAAGSGGANGSFALAFSGGGGTGAAGTFTVAGGVVTAVNITKRGKNYTSNPTVSVAASTGLTGATVTAARGNYAVPDGEYYLVKGTGNTFATLYKNVAGVATTQNLDIPSLAALTALSGLIVTGAYTGEILSFVDPNGNVVGGIRTDGSWHFGRVSADVLDIAGAVVSLSTVFEGNGNFPADIVYFPSYGQSLSIGTKATPSLTTTQRFDNLTFNGGIRFDADGGGLTSRASLVPLVETDAANVGGGPAGETPCGGASDMVKELIASEDGIVYTAQSFQLLCSAPGFGGTTIAQLAKPSARYTDFFSDVQAGATLAAAAGKSFKCLAFMWLQGESDVGNTTYDATLRTMRSDITADVRAITGQTEPVVCIAYEGTEQDTCLEFRQAVAADPNIVIAAAMYVFARSDGVHFTNTASKWFGAYAGRAFKRVIVDGTGWTPLQPQSTFRQGKIAEVKFSVPYGPLVFDTVNYSGQTNQGFRLFQPDGVTAMTISSVTITQPDTVRIVASANIPAGAILRYGLSDPTSHTMTFGGNLRDSDPTVFNGNGLNLAMHNWCLCFQETLA